MDELPTGAHVANVGISGNKSCAPTIRKVIGHILSDGGKPIANDIVHTLASMVLNILSK